MGDTLKDTVYSREVIEFVTVCVEYCLFLEKMESEELPEINDKLSKLLPLLYLKASLLPDTEVEEDSFLETCVTMDDYNYILSKLSSKYGVEDTYLEVFLDDMKYSDTPISASIAEDLTDIYQDIRNFIAIYEKGITEIMNESLHICIENFKQYWGQKLVNVLRAIHTLKYTNEENSSYVDDDWDDDNTNNIW